MSEQEIPVGTILELEISIQGLQELLKIKGKVVRIEKHENNMNGIGVQFIGMDGLSVENLQKVLKSSS